MEAGAKSRPQSAISIAGVLTLVCYGVVVNVLPWNFSRLMCAYYCGFHSDKPQIGIGSGLLAPVRSWYVRNRGLIHSVIAPTFSDSHINQRDKMAGIVLEDNYHLLHRIPVSVLRQTLLRG